MLTTAPKVRRVPVRSFLRPFSVVFSRRLTRCGLALPPGRSLARSPGRLPLCRRKPSPRQHHIHQAEQRIELRLVLGDAAIAHHSIAKATLPNVKGMLDRGSDARLASLDRLRFQAGLSSGNALINPRRSAICHVKSDRCASSGRFSAPV